MYTIFSSLCLMCRRKGALASLVLKRKERVCQGPRGVCGGQLAQRVCPKWPASEGVAAIGSLSSLAPGVVGGSPLAWQHFAVHFKTLSTHKQAPEADRQANFVALFYKMSSLRPRRGGIV